MTKPHYTADLIQAQQTHNPATGGPNPLLLTLTVPSRATALAILRDIHARRQPLSFHIYTRNTRLIEAKQPPFPDLAP